MRGAARQPTNTRHAAISVGIACLGVAACAAAFVLAPHDDLDEPVIVLLAACVIASSFVSLDIEGSLFWGGAAIPHVCAFALLGPAGAAVITALEEIAVWAVDRYRLRMFPINLFSTVAPNMLAGHAILGADTGWGYYALLTLVAGAAVGLNFLLVTALVGLFYGEPVFERLRRHSRLAAPIAINLAVAVAAVGLYRSAGIEATFFVIAGVLAFAYLIKRVELEGRHLARISQLAESRGRLVAQLLETEDRERRALAEVLHDDVIQRLLVLRQDLAELGPVGDAHPQRDIDEIVGSLRGTIRATHPSVLARVGLATAVATVAEFYAKRARFEVEVEIDPCLPSDHERALFSAARELLANVAKHADADHVSVEVRDDQDAVFLRVTDDGCGYTPTAAGTRLTNGHIGLETLRERVAAMGGEFRIGRGARQGTRAEVRLPKPLGATTVTPSPPELPSVSQH